MSTDTREALNRFLVDIFHSVLRNEERKLRQTGYDDLSISEMHVIEAACLLQAQGRNTAKGLADSLNITPGSLTASVNVLEQKGYLRRSRDPEDRRRIHITPTPRGLGAERCHRAIHEQMIDDVLSSLRHDEAEVLVQALEGVSRFFSSERTNDT